MRHFIIAILAGFFAMNLTNTPAFADAQQTNNKVENVKTSSKQPDLSWQTRYEDRIQNIQEEIKYNNLVAAILDPEEPLALEIQKENEKMQAEEKRLQLALKSKKPIKQTKASF